MQGLWRRWMWRAVVGHRRLEGHFLVHRSECECECECSVLSHASCHSTTRSRTSIQSLSALYQSPATLLAPYHYFHTHSQRELADPANHPLNISKTS